jgi:hypothetical protein
MRLTVSGAALLSLCLLSTAGCDNKAYYYTNGATESNPNPATTIAEPFVFEAQVSGADGKKITVVIFFHRIAGEKYTDASVEFACSQFAVVVDGKKLKPLRTLCSSGKELLQLKHINADFETPSGRPKVAVVTVPSIKVIAMDPPQAPIEAQQSSVTFTLREYDRGFGFR